MTPALSLAALFPGLANLQASSKDLTKLSQDLAKKDLALGEESWLAVLLAAGPLAWLAPSPLLGPAIEKEPAANQQQAAPVAGKAPSLPMVFVPRVLEASLPVPSPPALPFDEIPSLPPVIESPKPSLVEAALALAPPPPGESPPPLLAEPVRALVLSLPYEAAPPLVGEQVLLEESPPPPSAEPVRRLDPFPPAPEAFRLEVKWQPPAAEPGRPWVAAEAPEKPPEPAKPDRPETSRPPPAAVARPETADFSADGRSERDPDPERDPAPPPAARRSAPPVERATVLGKSEPAEPAPPGNQAETPVRPVRLIPPVEAPVSPPAPLRAAAGDPPPPPPPQPAQLHGLERAIERAELRQSPQTSELNLWMRPEHLGKVAVRLIERAGVVEIAVRAESSLARGWLAEGLPTLFDRLHERGFETGPALRGAEAGLDGRSQDHPDGRRQQSRDGQKRRDHREAALFSLEPGETS